MLLLHDLLLPFILNLGLLFRRESLEVVGYEPVGVAGVQRGVGVLSHQVGAVDLGDLELVLALLVVLPVALRVALGLGEALVFLLQFLHHVVALGSHLVLQHASHLVQG